MVLPDPEFDPEFDPFPGVTVDDPEAVAPGEVVLVGTAPPELLPPPLEHAVINKIRKQLIRFIGLSSDLSSITITRNL